VAKKRPGQAPRPNATLLASMRTLRLVFIDKTWTTTNMTRRTGWAPRGRKLVDRVPHGHWKTATFLAALRSNRVEAPCLFDGPINGERFLAYVEQFLVPTLKQGDIVVADNLGSHKGKAVRRTIKAAGARLLFLPKYSPDLNPIEQFSPSSRRSCVKPRRDPSTRSRSQTNPRSSSSPSASAPTTSGTQDMPTPNFTVS
jgi:transposase